MLELKLEDFSVIISKKMLHPPFQFPPSLREVAIIPESLSTLIIIQSGVCSIYPSMALDLYCQYVLYEQLYHLFFDL